MMILCEEAILCREIEHEDWTRGATRLDEKKIEEVVRCVYVWNIVVGRVHTLLCVLRVLYWSL